MQKLSFTCGLKDISPQLLAAKGRSPAILRVGRIDAVIHQNPPLLYKLGMATRAQLAFLLLLVLIRGRLGWATPQDFEAWAAAIALISLEDSKRYQLYVEAQPRLGDNLQRMAAVLSRTALVYNATPSLSIYGGYAWFPTFYDSNYHRAYRDDQRLWEQLLYKHDLWNITWHHRVRQEQRWIERTDSVSHRTRYMIKGSLTLSKANDYGITAFDEVMVNLNGVEGGPWGGYDRNRIFVGPFWLSGTARYEVGYLGEHAKRFGDDERWVHAVAVIALYSF